MLTNIKSLALLLVAVVVGLGCLPASAQGYHYSYGNARVVNQSQTGLYNPSSTYITNGTMSRSAQGLPAGVSSGGMSSLPNTNYGAVVRTPGDNEYTQSMIDQRLGHGRRSQVRRTGAYADQQSMPSDQHPYVPGQNADSGGHSGKYGNATHLPDSGDTYYQQPAYNVNKNGAYGYN